MFHFWTISPLRDAIRMENQSISLLCFWLLLIYSTLRVAILDYSFCCCYDDPVLCLQASQTVTRRQFQDNGGFRHTDYTGDDHHIFSYFNVNNLDFLNLMRANLGFSLLHVHLSLYIINFVQKKRKIPSFHQLFFKHQISEWPPGSIQ